MLGLVADRLKATAMPPFSAVAGGEDLAALAEGTAPADLTAFVVPFKQEAEPDERMTGPRLQRVRIWFLVAVCIRRYGDAKGGSRITATDDVDRALEIALLGWAPSADNDPISLIGARSQPGKNGVLWHVSTWETARMAEGS